MHDTGKYLIHARIVADGIVERKDVVGAIFGQTEGLLGDELDLRDLQDSSKVGRIDVEIDSENGQSFGEITIASGLDKVETAILAASLESIRRVGPCQARVEISDIEDTRSAERREIVERAKELLRESFDESVMESREILDEVRKAARVEQITSFEGLPAGPRVHDSDAVIVVEGRADVSTLLDAGIKNAVAVEGTNVPDPVAALTHERTVTAFMDGDRGGQLILRELAQVGDIDYVALAPEGRSVEDLSRGEVLEALREKIPYDAVFDADNVADTPSEYTDQLDVNNGTDRFEILPEGRDDTSVGTRDVSPEQAAGTTGTDDDQIGADGGADATAAIQHDTPTDDAPGSPEADGDSSEPTEPDAARSDQSGEDSSTTRATDESGSDPDAESATAETDTDFSDASDARSLREHVETVVGKTGRARLLDERLQEIDEVPVADTFETLADAEQTPTSLVMDGELTQRILDVAAQRGVAQVVAASTGEFVKQPADVRVLTADQFESIA